MAAMPTVAHPPPPPWLTMLKNRSRGIPRLRATSISKLRSIENSDMPSTSDGSTPASAQAARQASTARRMGVRPESLENSVAPMPTMAVRRANDPVIRTLPGRWAGTPLPCRVRGTRRCGRPAGPSR